MHGSPLSPFFAVVAGGSFLLILWVKKTAREMSTKIFFPCETSRQGRFWRILGVS
jgi:hypothetical protein